MSGRRGEEGDECLAWLVSRVERQFRTLKLDKLRKLVDSEEFRARAADFARVPDVTALFVWESGSGLSFGTSPPQPLRGRMVYFLKPADAAFTEAEAMKAALLYGEWPTSSLPALQRVVEDVYTPLLSNRRNQEGWTELVAKEVLGSVHSFLASVQIMSGQTQVRRARTRRRCRHFRPDPGVGGAGDAPHCGPAHRASRPCPRARPAYRCPPTRWGRRTRTRRTSSTSSSPAWSHGPSRSAPCCGRTRRRRSSRACTRAR